jgi:hypothetical protein
LEKDRNLRYQNAAAGSQSLAHKLKTDVFVDQLQPAAGHRLFSPPTRENGVLVSRTISGRIVGKLQGIFRSLVCR